MPNPTVAEVRELLEELPESWDAQNGYCLSQTAARTVHTLCRHFLASPMTAGEFAGLVKEFIDKRESYWRDGAAHLERIGGSESNDAKQKMLMLAGVFAECSAGVASLSKLHNITIAEPTNDRS